MTCNKLASQTPDTAGGRVPLFVVGLMGIAAVGFLCFSDAYAEYIGSDLVTVTMTDGQGHSASRGIANPFAHLPPQAQVPEHVQEMISERFDWRVINCCATSR